MALKVAVLLLYVVLGCCSSLECPTSFAPADNLDALGGASVNLYLDENDFDGGKQLHRARMGGASIDTHQLILHCLVQLFLSALT